MDSFFLPSFGGPFRRVHSIEEILNEMRGYISYIEDLNRSDRSKSSTIHGEDAKPLTEARSTKQMSEVRTDF